MTTTDKNAHVWVTGFTNTIATAAGSAPSPAAT